MKLFGNKKPENKKQESLISTQVAKLEKGMLSLPDVVAHLLLKLIFNLFELEKDILKPFLLLAILAMFRLIGSSL